MKKEFTHLEALNIQMDNIVAWSKVLNEDAYLELLKEISKRNKEGYKTPSDVCRGSDITCIVQNIMLNK